MQTDNEQKRILTRAHWDYILQVLTAHGVETRIKNLVGFHYQTAFEHGFKHGVDYEKNKK